MTQKDTVSEGQRERERETNNNSKEITTHQIMRKKNAAGKRDYMLYNSGGIV